jgi:hypothetical protein
MAIEIFRTPAHTWLKGHGSPIFVRFHRPGGTEKLQLQVCSEEGVLDSGAHLLSISPTGHVTLHTGIRRIVGLDLTSPRHTLFLNTDTE